jgi:phenylalanyl-tRNA synthetase beta chain
MKVSLNWVKQFIDFELPAVEELTKRIGAQLGAVEEVESLGEKYQGIPVVKVVVCEPLENSDHLHRCLIDDGGVVKDVERDEKGLVQVLTGAPNVHEGMLAVWLAPGMTVPESVGKDPFVLESRTMRGSMSHGMLASMKELALGDSHEGLIDIDKDVAPGTPFAEVYKLDDYIIDIENKMFTHRPDCFGALGVAREIAGILGHKFTSPEWYLSPRHPELVSGSLSEADGMPKQVRHDDTLELAVENEVPENVPRFTAIAIKDVEIKPSPLWLQVALLKVGAKSINNVVDLTNFYMLVTGQPLHAYDYDKVASGKLGARFAKQGEKLALLNGKTIELAEADMVITDGTKPIGLAGVMGGEATEVNDETKNIILECATFDMYAIRRTSMRHGLFTDAVTRFNKGQSPLQNRAVLAKITDDVQKMAGGSVASELVDIDHTKGRTSVHPPVTVAAEYINTRLGLNLSSEQMKTLLENVEFIVESRVKSQESRGNAATHDSELLSHDSAAELLVTAPFWRTDIELREDVVEEVGRLYGFDKLPLELPQRTIAPAAKNTTIQLKQEIRSRLARAGANEVLTYSFVHGDLLAKTGQNPEDAFKVDNALSPDLQYYRLSLMPSLLDKVHGNMKAGYDEFALFELGKAHIVGQNDDDGLPREDDLLAVVVASADKLKKSGAAYYAAQKYLRQLVRIQLVFKPVPEDMRHFDMLKPYDMTRSAFVYTLDDTFLGVIGEFRSTVRRALKLPTYTAGFELDIQALDGYGFTRPASSYVPISRFPKTAQDITLKVDEQLPHQALYDFLNEELSKHNLGGVPMPVFYNIYNGMKSNGVVMYGLTTRDIFQRTDDRAHKQITFRIEIASYERTLTDKEVNGLLDSVAAAAHDKFGAERL